MKIWVVDAFTDEIFKGNPAAVCIVKSFPTETLMQNIAAEMNLSQTTFVMPMPQEPHTYHIRWFTPNSEAPICGHATMAALHILVQEKYEKSGQNVVFNSLAGSLYASSSGKMITLDFPAYDVEEIPAIPQLNDVLGMQPKFTGISSNNSLFAELGKANDIYNLQPDLNLLSQMEYRSLTVTAKDKEESQYDFISRYFAPRVAIPEDPVCGSAHCRLAPYWAKKLNKNELLAYQASKRGGVLNCKLVKNRVFISSKAVTVIECTLKIK